MAFLLCVFIAVTSVASEREDRAQHRERSPEEHFSAAGEVFIRSLDKNLVGIVFVANRDGRHVRHLFRIWSDDAVPPLSVLSLDASMEYHGNQVVLFTGEGAMYAFGLKDVARSPLAAPPAMSPVTIEAIGINHEIRSAATRTGRATTEATCGIDDVSCVYDLDYYEQDLSGTGGGCSSGGPGSTSCSVTNGTGCSVSCSPGYYACCKDSWSQGTKCGCVKYGSTP